MEVELRKVALRFGRRVVLRDISATLQPGVTGLVGLNGSGKTTLMNAIVGVKQPATGTIEFRQGGAIVARPRIAYMPQSMNFPGYVKVREALAYALWMRGFAYHDTARLAEESLAYVDLSHVVDRRVRTLSGGMKRRLALAATIAGTNDLLVLDEPSTGLDPLQRESVVAILQKLSGSVIISSHILEDLYDVAHNILVIHENGIAFHGSLTDFLSLGDHPASSRGMWDSLSSILGVDPRAQ